MERLSARHLAKNADPHSDPPYGIGDQDRIISTVSMLPESGMTESKDGAAAIRIGHQRLKDDLSNANSADEGGCDGADRPPHRARKLKIDLLIRQDLEGPTSPHGIS